MTATPESVALAQAAADSAAEKMAEDILAFDVSDQLSISDIFLLCSAPNERQVAAIIDGVEERLRGMGAKPNHREGERDQRWVLLDYIDLVVHVQHSEERDYYALERLWRDCPLVALRDSESSVAEVGS